MLGIGHGLQWAGRAPAEDAVAVDNCRGDSPGHPSPAGIDPNCNLAQVGIGRACRRHGNPREWQNCCLRCAKLAVGGQRTSTCHFRHNRHRRIWCTGWCPAHSQNVGKHPCILLGQCDARKCSDLAGLQTKTMNGNWAKGFFGGKEGSGQKPWKTDGIGQA